MAEAVLLKSVDELQNIAPYKGTECVNNVIRKRNRAASGKFIIQILKMYVPDRSSYTCTSSPLLAA